MAGKVRGKWFNIWYDDKHSVLDTMYRNIMDDIAVGYDPDGECIRKQKAELDQYEENFWNEFDKLIMMDDNNIQRWCYRDLVKRGVIA